MRRWSSKNKDWRARVPIQTQERPREVEPVKSREDADMKELVVEDLEAAGMRFKQNVGLGMHRFHPRWVGFLSTNKANKLSCLFLSS